MGFSGGGSNVLKPHKHDGTVVQDGGPLDFDNITQADLTAGDVVFSDGVHLQRLAIGTPAQQLKVNAGATAPEYFTPAAGSAVYEEIASTTLGAPATHITLSGFSVSGADVAQFVLITQGGLAAGAGEELGVQVNGYTASTYDMERLNIKSGVVTSVPMTGSAYWKPFGEGGASGDRFFGRMYIQVDTTSTTPNVTMQSEFSNSDCHMLYSGHNDLTATALTEVKLYTVGMSGNIKTGSSASLFKINI